MTATEVVISTLKRAVCDLRDSAITGDKMNANLHEMAWTLIRDQQAEIERLSKLVKP